jgi:hypothetical protein
MSDWRLQNQESYLLGAKLSRLTFAIQDPAWDHEHCEFCGVKFSEAPGDLHEGYTTPDRYHWVCGPCFGDFKDQFKWVEAM